VSDLGESWEISAYRRASGRLLDNRSFSKEGSVAFDKPGTYVYICKDHPWSYGQLIFAAGNTLNGISKQEQAG
jgi:hypothetical protein